MPTRTYVTPLNFGSTNREFTLSTINNQTYLKIGALGADDTKWVESLIDGNVGFFQDGTRKAAPVIVNAYDADNGIPIGSKPALTIGEDYAIRFTQPRPGRDGTSGTGEPGRQGVPGLSAAIEIQDTPTGVRLRGKDGDATDFGEWHALRDGRDGRDGKDAASQFQGFLDPFPKGLAGRYYGALVPFPRHSLNPFPSHLDDRFYGELLGFQPNPEPNTAHDVLNLFDGVPEQVADYMWNLLRDRLPAPITPTQLRNEEETYNLIRARIEAYVTGYTQAYTQLEKNKLGGIENNATADQTAAEVIAILSALPVGSRLPFSWLDGRPTIPTDTLGWGGQWTTLTAYTAGTIVVDNDNVFIYIADVPATNTTRPASDTTRAEHLDVGSPLDLVGFSQNGLTITFMRRDGTSLNITITPTHIYDAIRAMTTEQKTGVRTAIDAQVAGSYAPAVHNHDGRYYTETETDTLLDGKADTGHGHSDLLTETAARALFSLLGHNHDARYYTETEADGRFAARRHSHSDLGTTAATVLAALVSMTNRQEDSARDAIKALGGIKAVDAGRIEVATRNKVKTAPAKGIAVIWYNTTPANRQGTVFIDIAMNGQTASVAGSNTVSAYFFTVEFY